MTIASAIPDTRSQPSPLVRWSLLVLAVIALIGLPVLFYRLKQGLVVTNLGSVVPWGVWVAFYIYFIGLSAGSFLLSSLVFVFKNHKLEPVGRIAVLQAFFCLLTGLVFILIDLGHWQRFYQAIIHPQFNSVLAWEIWFYLAYTALLLGELWLLMRCDLARWATEARDWRTRTYSVLSLGFRHPASDADKAELARRTQRWLMVLGIIGIPLALGVHGGTGAIFAVVKARPAWYSPIFPLVFIVSALASGGGLLLFLRALVVPQPDKDKEILPALARLTGAFLVADLLLLGLEFLTGLYGGIPDHVEVYRLITSGPFWYIFWVLQLGLGAVVALCLIFVKHQQAGPVRLGIAGFLVFVGIFGVRLNIVIPALAVPVLRGYEEAFDSERMSSLYVPNAVEWLSSLGIVAAATLAAYAAMRFLPMTENQPLAIASLQRSSAPTDSPGVRVIPDQATSGVKAEQSCTSSTTS
jgi:Ni/Fe-hydrogenase subunit HybB-like protein